MIDTKSSSTEELVAQFHTLNALAEEREKTFREVQTAEDFLVTRLQDVEARYTRFQAKAQDTLEKSLNEGRDNIVADFVGLQELIEKSNLGAAFAARLKDHIRYEALPAAQLRTAETRLALHETTGRLANVAVDIAERKLEADLAPLAASQGRVLSGLSPLFKPTSVLVESLRADAGTAWKEFDNSQVALADLKAKQTKDKATRAAHGFIGTAQTRNAIG